MDSLDEDFSDDDSGSIVSREIRNAAKAVSLNLLPDKSRRLYTAAYNAFKKWRREHGSNSFCEDVFLAYFAHLSTTYSPTSLWSTYSMLKCSINTYNQINISRYAKLISFLKQKSVGYRPKKSEVFTSQDICKFLNEAVDDVYLCDKVIMIFGIAGALRRDELLNLTVNHVKMLGENELLVKISKTKNNVPRSFVIAETLFHFCEKYIKLRPAICATDKFFLRYFKGKCTQQSIGINMFGALPKKIALFLNLSNAEEFTGHSFRRTSATLLVDAGAELTELMRHGGWKSSTVAAGYIADSLNNKRKICQQITNEIKKSNVATPSLTVSDNLTTNFEISQATVTSKSNENFNEMVSADSALQFCEASKDSSTFSSVSREICGANFFKSSTVRNVNLASKNLLIKSKIDVSVQTTETVTCIKKDAAVQTCTLNKSGSESDKNLRIRLPVFYDQDIGLFVQDSMDKNFNHF